MTGIQIFWTVVLSGAVLLFLIVEVVVVIGGGRDLAEMVDALRQAADDKSDKE
jgi:hypothetical protein